MSPTPSPPEPEAAASSRVSLSILTDPSQSNNHGTLHGGVILRLLDECGALAASRHAGDGPLVTAAIDGISFLAPVEIGERLELLAEVVAVGRSSIEARVVGFAESKAGANRRKVCLGYALYVALDDLGVPRSVAPLPCQTEADRRRDEAARLRREFREARRVEAD